MRRDRRNAYDAKLSAALSLLCALTFAISGPGFAQTAAGTFATVIGQVQIQRAGATIGAASGVGVNVGDRILTGASGHAVIMLGDQSRLEIGPVSSITLEQFTVSGGAASTRVSLFSGVLRSMVSSATDGGAVNYQVHTPNAVAVVRGGKIDTAYTENVIRPGYQGCERYTDVSVYQGTVNLAQLASPNTGQDVGAGYEATLPCDKPATSPGPLAMTGAVSLDSAAAGAHTLFAASMPGPSGAPVPGCTVCVPVPDPVPVPANVGRAP